MSLNFLNGTNPHTSQRGLLNLRFFGILGLSLIFIIGMAYFFYGLQPNTVKAAAVQFKVVKGDGVREIGARLSQLSLIKSISVFKMYTLLSGKAGKFKPGVYEVNAGLSIPEIVAVLVGNPKEAKVVIPEGSTLKEIDGILADNGVISPGSLISVSVKDFSSQYPFLADVDSLEGFIFPDTYQFKLDTPVMEVLKTMLDNFETKGWSLLKDEADWYNRLILASFLEKEVPDFNDRQLVAGILLKRMAAKMPLQVDATITYAKCDGDIKDCANPLVSKKDLTIASPYNTYQRLGLTPTPIANPGQAAIKAALSPEKSSYWYYLSVTTTKDTIFSKTLEEHNLNRAKYL